MLMSGAQVSDRAQIQQAKSTVFNAQHLKKSTYSTTQHNVLCVHSVFPDSLGVPGCDVYFSTISVSPSP